MNNRALEIKHYKILVLPSVVSPNSVYYLLDQTTGKVKTYISDKNGIPIPLIDLTGIGQVITVTGTGVTGTPTNPIVSISSFISEQLGNQVHLSVEDGKLQVNPITSPNLSIEVNSTSTELQLQLSALITAKINSALQSGDNISELTNDANYITIAEVEGTDLEYNATPLDGTITSSTGADATLPLATTANSGLLAPADKIKLNNTSNSNSGDQDSIVGITGTKSEFNTSLTDGEFLFDGDITQYTDELAQDAIGVILTDTSTIDITYDDVTPAISATVKANSITANELSNTINNSEFVNDSNYENTSQLDARDVNNRARVNHTGTQLSSTISDFTTAARTASVSDSITDAITNIAPSQNAVFDALALKQNTLINPITGSLTANYIPKATGANTLDNSQVFDNGTSVGIGTTTPSQKLHVAINDSEFSTNVLLENTNTSTSSLAGITLKTANNAGTFTLAQVNASGDVSVYNASNSNIGFSTNALERMRINAGGNLGIGTNSDNGIDKLQVNGTVSGGDATLSNQFVTKSQLDLKENLANKISTITGYSEILYPNEKATKDALDAKLNISDLPSNLTLYATNVPSGISTYTKWVTTINDPDYNTTAVNVSTGTINGTAQLISGLSSIGGVIVGNPGEINVTTVGNIRRTAGTGTAKFYFELYKRSDAGVEEFLGVSNFTLPVNFETYAEFSATSILNNGVFLATDRLVIKFYGSRIAGGSDPTFQFQFGGLTPVRTIVPVPFRVLASEYELKANKVSTLTASDILYPNNNAVIAGLATKQNTISGTANVIPKFGTGGLVGSNISDSGTIVSTSTDISVNGLTLGRAGGNLLSNVAFGSVAGLSNTTGTNNYFGGTASGYNNTIGLRNYYGGHSSGLNNTSGSYNVFSGGFSGRNIANKTTPATVINNSVMIGYDTSPLGNNQTNQIVIGSDAIGNGSNSTVIGNTSTLRSTLYGRFLANQTVDNGIDGGQFGTATVSGGNATLSNQFTTFGQVFTSPTFTGIPTVPTATAGTNTTQIASTGFVTSGLETKQNTLVSGTNIKTINGVTILGSGDLVIDGGGTGSTEVSPTDFTGTDTEKIQAAVNYASENEVPMIIPKKDAINTPWDIETAILLKSNTTMTIDGAILKLTDTSRDNIFRTENCGLGLVSPYTVLENIHINGLNGAMLQGADNPRATGDSGKILVTNTTNDYSHSYGTDAGVGGQTQTGDWRNVMVLFAYTTRYSIKGLRFNNAHCWTVLSERCSKGRIENLYGQLFGTRIIPGVGTRYVKNNDFVDITFGCSDIIIKDITGHSDDDSVAIAIVESTDAQGVYGARFVTGGVYGGVQDDIHDIIIKDISTSTIENNVRLLNILNTKLYNITIENITNINTSALAGTVVQIGSTNYGESANLGETYNISINNIKNTFKDYCVKVNGSLSESNISNLIDLSAANTEHPLYINPAGKGIRDVSTSNIFKKNYFIDIAGFVGNVNKRSGLRVNKISKKLELFDELRTLTGEVIAKDTTSPTEIKLFWSGTQAAYNLLTPNASTIYIIVG